MHKIRLLLVVPSPLDALHCFILVLARPHNSPTVYCSYVERSSKEPQYHKEDSRRATHAIDARGVEGFPHLYRGKSPSSIWEDEAPPVERKCHTFGSGNDCKRTDAEEPEVE